MQGKKARQLSVIAVLAVQAEEATAFVRFRDGQVLADRGLFA